MVNIVTAGGVTVEFGSKLTIFLLICDDFFKTNCHLTKLFKHDYICKSVSQNAANFYKGRQNYCKSSSVHHQIIMLMKEKIIENCAQHVRDYLITFWVDFNA